jgi:hypothetical protein
LIDTYVISAQAGTCDNGQDHNIASLRRLFMTIPQLLKITSR